MRRSFPNKDRFFGCRYALSYWVLVVFFVLVFMMGGGSRSDIQSLVIIRPLAVLFLGYGIWGLAREHIATYRFLFWMAFAILCLTALHLVPFPPIIWHSLPGRLLLVEIDGIVSGLEIWRPISMIPSATWNALYALLVPVAALVLLSQLDRENQFRLLGVLIALGLFSVILGLMQSVGLSRSTLYLYRITNEGAPVGLFANRNHHAVFLSCMFPMLAVYISIGAQTKRAARVKLWLAIAAAAVVIPLILVTGSRAGFFTAVLGVLATPFLYRSQKVCSPVKRKTQKIYPQYIIGAIGIVLIAFITFLSARGQTFNRLLNTSKSEEMRFAMWGPIWRMVEQYFPIGSGIGSFIEVYQIYEPDSLLTPQFVPHAHNDWLEVAMTAGLPGIILILAGTIAFVNAAFRSIRRNKDESRDVLFARLGVVIITLMGIASIADYPLRVPSLACFFVLAAIWASMGFSNHRKVLAVPDVVV